MIPDQWYAILEADELPAGEPIALRRLAWISWRGATAAESPTSWRIGPHRGAALSLGRIVSDRIECPYHGFLFEAGGRCTYMPCEGRNARIPQGMEVGSFAVREAHGFLWLW